MSKFNNKFDSIRQDWETPDSLFAAIQARYNLTFDLAANKDNTKFNNYFSKESDALNKDWKGRYGG